MIHYISSTVFHQLLNKYMHTSIYTYTHMYTSNICKCLHMSWQHLSMDMCAFCDFGDPAFPSQTGQGGSLRCRSRRRHEGVAGVLGFTRRLCCLNCWKTQRSICPQTCTRSATMLSPDTHFWVQAREARMGGPGVQPRAAGLREVMV